MKCNRCGSDMLHEMNDGEGTVILHTKDMCIATLKAQRNKAREKLVEALRLIDTLNANLQGQQNGEVSDPISYTIATSFIKEANELLATIPRDPRDDT